MGDKAGRFGSTDPSAVAVTRIGHKWWIYRPGSHDHYVSVTLASRSCDLADCHGSWPVSIHGPKKKSRMQRAFLECPAVPWLPKKKKMPEWCPGMAWFID